jgi:hypothetical protein
VDCDTGLDALTAEHCRFDKKVAAAQNEADVLNSAERCAGHVESSRLRAIYGRVEALHAAQAKVANAIINLPAASFAGVALKLVLWRKEAAMRFAYDFDSAHETFVFSAYQDMLRLTGLTSRVHEYDRETAARMRAYWLTALPASA